jgi:hypothetical protein
MNDNQNMNSVNSVNVVNDNVMNNSMINTIPKKSNLWLILGCLGLFSVVLVVVLTLTSGGTHLTCVHETELYGMLEEDRIKIYYDDNDNPTKVVITMKTEVTEDSSFTVESLKEAYQTKVDDYEEKGAKVSMTSDEDVVTYTITIDEDDFSSFFDTMGSYDEMKQLYDKRGFTCN